MKDVFVKWAIMILTIAFLSGISTAAYAHGVICDQTMVGENTLRVKLKWSDPGNTKGINIVSRTPVMQGRFVDIAYEIVDSGSFSDSDDFDARSILPLASNRAAGSFLPPLSIRLYNIADYDKPIFDDLKGHYAERYVHQLHDAGIINGKSENEFRPDDPLTRAEFMVMMSKALRLSGIAENTQGFSDVDKHWAENQILLAVKNGLVSGYGDKTIRPNKSLSVGEVCSILSKAFTFKTNNNGIYAKLHQNRWYSASVKRLFDAGIINIKDNIYSDFNEDASISRADMAMMLSRALSSY